RGYTNERRIGGHAESRDSTYLVPAYEVLARHDRSAAGSGGRVRRSPGATQAYAARHHHRTADHQRRNAYRREVEQGKRLEPRLRKPLGYDDVRRRGNQRE